jgi:SAM-dependent methyltransferase
MDTGNPAETYERFMVPPLFAPCARQLVEAAGVGPGSRVLDVGCGTGVVARHAAARVGPGGAVAGLDASPAMLAVARRVAAEEGARIDWHEGRAERLPFPAGAFDRVLCQFALMFVADRAAAATEMHRVLATGGQVAVSVFQELDRHPFYRALDEAIRRRLGESGVADIFTLGDGHALAASLGRAGFRDVRLVPLAVTARFPDPDRFLAGEIDVDTASIPAMQHLEAGARRALTAALREDLRGPLAAVTEGGAVVLPFHGHMALGVR